MTWTFKLSDLYQVKKETLSVTLFHLGLLIAFLGSMSPWFMWAVGSLYPVPAAMLIVASLLVSRTMEEPVFTRSDYLLPLLAFVIYSVYECLASECNINAYLMIAFKAVIVFSLLQLNAERLFHLTTFIAKVMGVLLAASLAGHFLYLLGFPLPGRPAQLGEFYSFTNHYLFLLDDRNLFTIVPRFNSYFPEPGHVGSAAAFLLFAQRGHWRKWYNMVLLATIFFSFSLASYIYLTAIVFLNLWIEKKNMFRKLAITVGFFLAAITLAFTYNGGDNLVHDLILLRLEVDDDSLAGDNRVTGNFEKDYDNYLGSSDMIFGRTYDSSLEFGNAGFKVFFFDYGLVGILLVFLFYFLAMRNAPNKRAALSACIILSLYFIVSAYMFLEKILLPMYAAAYRDDVKT